MVCETSTCARNGPFCHDIAPRHDLLGPNGPRSGLTLRRAEADEDQVLVFKIADPDYFISTRPTRIDEYRVGGD